MALPRRLILSYWETVFSKAQNSASAGEQKYEIRSSHGRGDNDCPELLVTGCRYAQVVDRSRVFSFDDMDDAETQMKSLYYNLPTLREYVDAEGMQDYGTTLSNLGQRIMDGKQETTDTRPVLTYPLAISLIDGASLHYYLNRALGMVPVS
jgi:hypothetical protein